VRQYLLGKSKSLGPEHTGVDCMSMTTIFSKIQTYMASGFMTNGICSRRRQASVYCQGADPLGDCICGSRAKILCETMPGWF